MPRGSARASRLGVAAPVAATGLSASLRPTTGTVLDAELGGPGRPAAPPRAAVEQRHRLVIFSGRLLDALDSGDDERAAVARRRLREVLDEVG